VLNIRCSRIERDIPQIAAADPVSAGFHTSQP
jgi:hypothetical protein